MDIVNRIKELKEQRNAVILAHYYQSPEIQDIADFIGDSFELARKAKETEAEVIVFCGVHFMAESAKILSPNKTVLLPAVNAGCQMAGMVDAERMVELRKKHPNAAFVCYVNTSAAVKAECDVSCTSSNAVLICSSLPQEEIVFLPDRNLGGFVAKQTDKKFAFYEGYCATHDRITADEVRAAREAMPGAKVLVHPECRAEIVEMADFAGSTAQILKYVKESEDKQFIIGTEKGILHQLTLQNPGKEFKLLTPRLVCPDMKKTTLEDVLRVLENPEQGIELDAQIIEKAYKCLNTMLEIVKNNKDK